MYKRFCLLLSALFIFAILPLAGCSGEEPPDPGEMVVWVDPIFEAAIRAELGRPAGPIRSGELREIRTVNIRSNMIQFGGTTSVGAHHMHDRAVGVQVLDDLLSFPSILILDVSFTYIEDFSPLNRLEDLQRLNLYHNPNLTDLSFLNGLNLVTLVLNDLPVDDYSPVLSLSTLVNLEIYRSNLTTLNMRGRFPELRRLNLNRNNISDISFLESYVDLTYLDLRDNQITDITPLSGMSEMFSLSLSGNPISNIAPVAEMGQLRQLSISQTNVSDLRPLSGLRWLALLYVRNSQVASVEPISGLTDLRMLDLGRNQITSVRPLENLNNLIELDVSDNLLTDVTALHGMRGLRDLNVSDNNLTPAQIRALEESLSGVEISS
ncbi:MAG: leucine-rich repeat domain-containing protein [Oscillospiraceae bacterium]|nr:leucine-rich repeat domain-containing protein [Oscillospiraceae bacterium]